MSSGRIVFAAPLMAAAALLALTLAVSFATPRAGIVPAAEPAAGVVAERWLRFADREDGAVVVSDAADGRTLDIVTGPSGFLRGTMSGLAQIRRTEGLGAAAPFRLAALADHRLVLADPATGRAIELEAFGPTNEGVFARFLSE